MVSSVSHAQSVLPGLPQLISGTQTIPKPQAFADAGLTGSP